MGAVSDVTDATFDEVVLTENGLADARLEIKQCVARRRTDHGRIRCTVLVHHLFRSEQHRPPRAAGVVDLAPERFHRGEQSETLPYFGPAFSSAFDIASIIWSTLKLATRWLGGYSLNVWRNGATRQTPYCRR